MERNIR